MKYLFFFLVTATLYAKQPHPISRVNQWCKEEKKLNEDRYVIFGTLASTSPNGTPHTRMIEISHFNKNKGALFFTHKNTRKVSDFQNNPRASLSLWLPKTRRQITLEGQVREISPNESEKYWKCMPRFKKLLFLASNHTGKLESEELLQKKKKTLETELPKDIPMPITFVGYRLLPYEVIFRQINHRDFSRKEIATFEKESWITHLFEP